MTRISRLATGLFLFLCFAFWFTPDGSAHPAKTALTTVSSNPNTGRIEIVHRFVLHDAEEAVQKHTGPTASLLGIDDTARKAFEEYTVANFQIGVEQGGSAQGWAVLGAHIVGSEIDAGYYWVYLEANDPPDVLTGGLRVSNTLLMDVFPTQVNAVNIMRGEAGIATVEFDRATGSQRLAPTGP